MINLEGRSLDRGSHAFADASASAILKGWNEQALAQRATAQLRAALKSPADAGLFSRWRELGQFRSWDGCNGAATVELTPDAKALVTAHYTGRAEFERGMAEVKFALIQESGAWRILGFGVYPAETEAAR